MRTIAIANQKGGCGKTTVAINLSASLAREGFRTLLVDLDPQSHCALGMAVPEEQIDLSIVDCLVGQIEGDPVELSRITWQIAPRLDVAPSRANLASLEPRFAAREDATTMLRDLLSANEGRYDYCVVDCPPHMGLLMKNGLRAASHVIIPVDTGYFSLYGLTQQLATIEQLGTRNESMPKVRVLPNQYDVRTKLAREILAELRKRFEGVVFETIINFNTKLKEGASFGQPITEFAPTSMGAKDFQALAREVTASEPAKVAASDLLRHVEKLSADAERLLATTNVLVDRRTQERFDQAHAAAEAGSPHAAPPADASRAAPMPARRAAHAAATPTAVPSERTVAVASAPAAQKARPVEMPTAAKSDTAIPTGPVPSDRIVQPGTLVGKKREPTDHAEIERKIQQVYGVVQEGDVAVFRSHSAEASEVQLAGDFNDWMPHTTPMRRLPDGDFEARLRLPKGRYRYRLVVDGRWSHDRGNPMVESNEYGELNSIVEVTQ